jgi:hypothetical protein
MSMSENIMSGGMSYQKLSLLTTTTLVSYKAHWDEDLCASETGVVVSL